MAMIVRGLLVGALASALVACAGPASRTAGDATSAAAASDQLRALAGRWQGGLSEIAGWYYQGYVPLDLTLGQDGTWTGTIGGARAAGTAELAGRLLVLRGTARSGEGQEEPVYLALIGDGTRRWGETVARFGTRQERANVSLRKTG